MVEYVTSTNRTVRFDAGRNTGTTVTNRVCAQKVMEKPLTNSKGNVIVFDNGSTYRKHTFHAVSSAWYEDAGATSASAKILTPPWTGNKGSFATGPGGGADHFLNAVKNACLTGIDIGNTRKPPSIPTGRKNEVVTKALLKLADSKASLGEDLATFAQTFRLLRDPIQSLVKGIQKVADDGSFRPFLAKSLRDLNREGPLNALARRYLEYVYGWRPLMQEVFSLTEMAKAKASAPLLLKVNCTTRRGGVGPSYSYEDYSTKEVSAFDSVQFEDRVSCTLVARVDPGHAGLRTLNQLGLVNPLSLAWELVPFSFVVDWLVPVGSMLQSFSAPAGLQFVTGSVARRVSASAPFKASTNIFNQVYPSYSGQSVSPGTGTFRYEGYAREALGFWPSTGLWIDIDPLRADRSLKATALVIVGMKNQRDFIRKIR